MTICAECRFYWRAYCGCHFPPSMRIAKCSAKVKNAIDPVTGNTYTDGFVPCVDKNKGNCPDYQYDGRVKS